MHGQRVIELVNIEEQVRTRLIRLDSATCLEDLRALRGNRLKPLRGSRTGQFIIRVNDQFRICFKWNTKGPTDVEIADYHREEAAADSSGQNPARGPEG
jgi:proteic killer suppression protein